MNKIGIIGGSGLDDPQFLTDAVEKEFDTPYGMPSSVLKEGTIGETKVVFLARHGKQHTIPPSGVNYRANIDALKQTGCAYILATTAVGSLREDIKRGDFVILDQFIDFTKRRLNTFHETFKPGSPVHTPMAEPFSARLRSLLIEKARLLDMPFHGTGTVITIEGPRFSTKAESHMFRQWQADVINMTIATEAALAVEAGIPYAAVAMSTDYDCWKEDETPVSWDDIVEVFNSNVEKIKSLLLKVLRDL